MRSGSPGPGEETSQVSCLYTSLARRQGPWRGPNIHGHHAGSLKECAETRATVGLGPRVPVRGPRKQGLGGEGREKDLEKRG